MCNRTISEELFEQLCLASNVPCELVATGTGRRTPDFRIRLGSVQVICEVKQINPNDEDRADLADVCSDEAVGRLVRNRLREKLKDVSAQLKAACQDGCPTLLVFYDNTPFKIYTLHSDVVQAMFGQDSVKISFSGKPDHPAVVSQPFFGGNRGLTPRQNTSVSALAILDGSPISGLTLRVYHNPYALVVLRPEVLEVLPVTQCLVPGATRVAL
jgi:hypothetical protein